MRPSHVYATAFAVLLATSVSVAQSRDPSAASRRANASAERLVEQAAAALGGEAALGDLARLRYTASGHRFAIGQSAEPNGPTRALNQFEQQVSVDLALDALREDTTRAVAYPFQADTSHRYVIVSDRGYLFGVNNILGIPEGPLHSGRTAAVRKQHLLLNPQLVLRHVLQHPGALLGHRPGRRGRAAALVVDVRALGGGEQPITLRIAQPSGRIVGAHLVENNYLLRDVPVTVSYEDYRPAGSLNLPHHIELRVAGELVLAEERTDVQVNLAFEPGTFDFPAGPAPDPSAAARAASSHQWHQEFEGAAVPLDQEDLNVVGTEIAPGVFHLTGAIHHSLVVEQAEGIVVIEAPLYPERGEALIAWIAERFGDKPITHVVATHHHADHAGGLRAFVAEGATVVASRLARKLYRRVFRAPSRISPDRLSDTRVRARGQFVGPSETLTLPDAQRPVKVHHVPSAHASDNVLISLPQQGIVFQSDLYSPGFPLNPSLGAELRDAIVDLGLDATLMPAGHGSVGSFAALLDALAATEP